MSKLLSLFFVIAGSIVLSGCSTPTLSEYQYHPDYQQVQRIDYSSYYKLSPIPLNGQMEPELEVLMITHLDEQGLPGEYSIRKLSGYFDTRQYVANARATLYLQNNSEQHKRFDLKAIIVEQQKLPLSTHTFELGPQQGLSWSLGVVPVDLRLHRFSTRVEYVYDGQHQESYHQQRRLTQQQARQELRGLQIPNSL